MSLAVKYGRRVGVNPPCQHFLQHWLPPTPLLEPLRDCCSAEVVEEDAVEVNYTILQQLSVDLTYLPSSCFKLMFWEVSDLWQHIVDAS